MLQNRNFTRSREPYERFRSSELYSRFVVFRFRLLLSECDSSHAMFLVFRVSFLFCVFSALFAHLYFTVVSRLSSVRSGRARSTPSTSLLFDDPGAQQVCSIPRGFGHKGRILLRPCSSHRATKRNRQLRDTASHVRNRPDANTDHPTSRPRYFHTKAQTRPWAPTSRHHPPPLSSNHVPLT